MTSKSRKIQVINRWVPRWAKINLWIFGIEVERHGPLMESGMLVPGCDAQGHGRIFVMNHRSGLDIPVVLTTVEAHCISRHDISTWPFLGRCAAVSARCLSIGNRVVAELPFERQVAENVERGEAVAMFPEGTSYSGDEVRPLHNGAFSAARRLSAELIPMGIAYDDPAAYYEAESFIDHVKRLAKLRRLRVAVEVGTPLEYADVPIAEVTELARERIQELGQSRPRSLGERLS